MSRAEHVNSVNATIAALDTLTQTLSLASQQGDALADMLDASVSGGPAGGPGEQAERLAHAVRSDITGLLRTLHETRTHLADYLSRF